MKIQIRSGLTALSLAVLAAFALAPAAEAKVYKLHLELTGKAETPPNTSKGKGHGSVTYDDQSNDLSWDISWSGLTGDATAAHFHGPAKPGASAPPVVPIQDKQIASPLIGSTTITADQGKDLLAGKWYFNVHTAANAGGELRGQVLKGGDAKSKAKAEAPASGDAAPADKPAKHKKAKKADTPATAAAPQ